MTANDSRIAERMPVWRALSEFFIDTKLVDEDCDRIAAILAESPYTESQLEEILRCEVLPICRWNWISMVGEWSAFSDEWLQLRITPLIDRRPWYWKYVFGQVIEPWGNVKKGIISIRAGARDSLPR